MIDSDGLFMWNTFDLRETLVGILQSRHIVKLNFKHSGKSQHSTLTVHQQLLNQQSETKNSSPMNVNMATFKDSRCQNFSINECR
jgi:hypothetical protein